MTKLKDVCTIIAGQSPESKYYNTDGNGLPFFQGKADFGDLYPTIRVYCTQPTKIVEKDDILLSVRAPVGATNLAPCKVCIGRGLTAIRPKEELELKYLLYYFRYIEKPLQQKGTGTTFKAITQNVVKNLEINVPAKDEQRRIVAKIEELFSQLDSGVETLKKTKAQLAVYRQAVLKEAFNSNSWNCVPIGELCDCIVPNRDKPKSFSGNVKWITTPELSENSIYIDYNSVEMGLTDDEITLYKAKTIPIDSVIMTCVGKFGVSAIVKEPIVINQQLHAFLPSKDIDSRFLAYYIKFKKRYFEDKATATTIKYLNKKNCNSMPFPIIDIETQQIIVKEIESRLSVCDSIEKTVDKALQQAEGLRQSILKKAFEGEM